MILAAAEKAQWVAAEALLDKRDIEAERIWRDFNARGIDAVRDVMEYLVVLEGQNKRLNKRIEQIETQIRFLDRMEKLIELKKQSAA